MLVKTGKGSISFVAGCCWVNSVVEPPPLRTDSNDNNSHPFPWTSTQRGQRTAIAADRDEPCDEAMISKQRQRYLVSLLSDQEQQSDSQYREQ